MANAASLTNFSSPSLDVGDWLYSIYNRSAPAYLPLNDATATYLASSYPTLFGLIGDVYKIIPVSTTGTAAATTFDSRPAYGNGVWVAVHQTTTSYKTSTDGLTWTARTGTTAASNGVFPVAYGAGVFVSVGNGVASSSPDGITWTTRASFPATLRAANVAWNGSVFVCVGSTSAGAATTVAATSPDGITWTSRTIPSGIYTYLAYGAGLWVALSGVSGTYGTYATSPDGITWTARTNPNNFTDGGVAFGNGFFVLIMSNSTFYSTSVDGINWTTRNWGGTFANSALTFGDGVFVTYNNNSANGMRYTTDGIVWLSTNTATGITPSYIAPSVSGNFFYSNGTSTPYRENLAISTTQFTLPVVTALTNTRTYVKAT